MARTKKRHEAALRTGRVMETFWLDIRKPAERWLEEQIEALKKQRKFSQYVRDGLRLMIDLSACKTDVLVELFPWIADRLRPAETPAADEFELLFNEIARLRSEINARALPMTVPVLAYEPPVSEADTRPAIPVTAGASRANFSSSISSFFDD